MSGYAEIANFVLLGVVAAACIPMLIRANGTRPFIAGYTALSLLFLFNTTTDMIGDVPLSRAESRLIFESIIIVTMAWAIVKRKH